MTIAAQVLAGLREAGTATGNGPLELVFTRAGAAQVNPWDAVATPTSYTLTGVDMGIKTRYGADSAVRSARMLMVDATGTAPQVGDKVTVSGRVHDVLAVMPEAPAGVALYYEVEISN